MNILVVKTPEELAEAGYKLIEEVIKTKENPTLGMATGSSPLGIYAEMRKNKLDTSRVTTVNLDEYVNLPHEDKNSYHYFMQEQLFDHLPFKQTYVPNGMASDLEEECKRYEGILAANPVDLQILGIGENGHIGFNEPGTPFNSPTNIVELTESTRQANLRFFEKEEDVPTHAITMGIGSIMKAKQILLVAMGSKKAEAVKELLQGAYSEACPATVLQRHPNVTVIADQEALSLCSEAIADEHRQVFTISDLLSDSRVGETAN
ncbi:MULTISPECIES: glucosamine-6-phosphate deaminase [unclassified Bacillus cereus group]|uniref:glucosamine-6-phosphate deaminase n=1 Tax=Bacillus cereus group TaxID=86661 RepID=UPI001F589A8C|nr:MULTISPECIES: glucosamine-6-phosphate deaminase [unclassified Bacillus cereus group]MDA1534948.1 glucosamine-6-phosphate deaminase [Bacillus cereus group sp. TH254-2LC]MDA1543139.1 glucosamine-6-phosphate deaminase [Bacillus cereus group sp. TH253LC]MDA1577704.1 glucosamine-6-phosphate deaminase [Bacillus cereus group sp. TH228LC]MDA1626641.1 glucosamine-6-phosphate deaminase [Bacillus cereus group sp. TH172LC]MDA1830984.1 glucosamine-6-phosphate deaminase [Bacillus cereus group sp. BY142LC